MRNYLCWEPEAVRRVINPFAEHIRDSLFRAVHTDWDLRVSKPLGQSFQAISDSDWEEMKPAVFLRDFLSEGRPHALAVILGQTGSGKSHLVHWMRLNIREEKQRMILVVRKAGTNLRKIVHDIIGRLPEDQQQSFLDTFKLAGDGAMSAETRKHELLNHLAQAIREDQAPPGADELEEELLKSLPHLLQDPYMRKMHFLRDDGIVGHIVEHIFTDSNASDRPDRRRLFNEEDLEFGGMDFVYATRLAKDVLDLIELNRAENLPIAIDIINRNLDRAIARTLSFSGDRVEELMARLRTHLKTQGRELILLVEEFARLQGIDRALLQAITSHGDERQCLMRTAIAVTTGFLASVPATAYMRTTHIVDMDRSAGRAEGQEVTPDSLAEFASRYLNAARLGLKRIDNWSQSASPHEAAPSSCTECPYRHECHETFGEVDGYGLYPFTKTALWNGASRLWDAASRTDARLMPKTLNPRILQNDLLVEVLDNFAPSIKSGEFPPPKLLQKLGGVQKLPLSAETDLHSRNPHVAGRWEAFLEIYDGSGEIVNLPAPLRNAFGVPEIPNAIVRALKLVSTTPEVLSSPSLDTDYLGIEEWTRGEGLDEKIAGRLRNTLFPAIAESIDWDMLGLARTEFFAKTDGFQRTSITFLRQNTKPPDYLKVRFQISPNPKTGQALQGLLRAAKDKDNFCWLFEGGDRALTAFLDCLEDWSGEVTSQLRRIRTLSPSQNWNQGIAALQLLCVGAAIVGRLKPGASEAQMIDAAFAAWPEDTAASAPELRNLYGKLFKERVALVKAARSQLSSMKGGQARSMLQARFVVPAIRALRKAKWVLSLQPPETTDKLAKLYRDIASGLEKATEAERTLRLRWMAEMEAAFGSGANRTLIVSALESARLAALNAGVATQNTSAQFGEALESFKSTQYDAAVAAVRELAQSDTALAALPIYGKGNRNAVDAGTALRAATEKFVEAVDRSLETYSQDQSSSTNELEQNIKLIEQSLDDIAADLRSLTERKKADYAS